MPAVMSHPLARIVDQLKRQPSRTGSLVITVYGDAIVPRGGSVWLGTLLSFFEALNIDHGGVRTAMSRLAADGWLERARVGRNSFYRLADKGRETFAAATRHIYAAQRPEWTGRFDLLLVPNGNGGGDRDGLRENFRTAGFGSPVAGLWLAPAGTPAPEGAEQAIRLEAEVRTSEIDGAVRHLIEASWPLERIAAAYRTFLKTFAPLHEWVRRDGELSDLDALVARILLIHQYRRIILPDPLLPDAMLPADWPGTAARLLCAEVYPSLLAGSERWLDAHASNEQGPLPAADNALWRRFQP